ncbi:C-C motif chemokine 3-like 1 [Paramisgurnus dabryanus]|uniref:C-C motif chemokine 3-like 1 n=1 Tax=Paramisgurnus dabryanus TaxID=90735 RepID=UPI003CCFA6DB
MANINTQDNLPLTTQQNTQITMSTDSNMRLYYIVACFVLFAISSLTSSVAPQGPDKCCFSFSNVRIPVKQIVGYHITHDQCHKDGIFFIMKSGNEICADLNERWVQRLKKLVDARDLIDMIEVRSGETY